MMNGHGKSDRPVVPAKSPNNGEGPRASPGAGGTSAAEGMEGRGLAKGNRLRQNGLRPPSRVSASSALERIRQAARADKKMRFTALLHHVYNPNTLRDAYFALK
jgi:RNA-directed DNA polymerase